MVIQDLMEHRVGAMDVEEIGVASAAVTEICPSRRVGHFKALC